MVAHKIDGTMLQHGIVFTLYHASYKRLSRIIGSVVLAFVAYSSCAFYLLVDAEFSWLLQPDFKRWSLYFHCFCSFVLIAKVHFLCILQNNYLLFRTIYYNVQ